MKKGISFTILSMSVIFSLYLCAEEGLHIVHGKSPSEVIQKISEFYHLEKKEVASLQMWFEKAVLSIFKIRKWNGIEWGSGVFVGPAGQFVTAAHVMDGVGVYEIERTRLKEGKFESYKEQKQIHIIRRFIPPALHDQVWGVVEGVTGRNYLEPSDKRLNIGSRIILIGFPGPTRRKEESRDLLVMEKPEWLTESKAESRAYELKRQLEEDDLDPYTRRLYDLVLMVREEWSKRRSQTEGCDRLPEPTFRGLSPVGFSPLTKIYDEIPEPDKNGLSLMALSSGTIQWFDDDFVITEVDTVGGMSGGPLIDLLSGRVVATHFMGYRLNEYRAEYGGAALARRVK